uniref:Ribonuclease H-like domain-containing protein n=1 Tax=Tanacetum cinerariifolium TaxID=118510 RepID=A0A6L2LDH9_TANCI|nr:ribonuclease H-like domain-containing protein [Tanacetum cinerariifolium]
MLDEYNALITNYDIILTASSTLLLQRIIVMLQSDFAMTDLGSLNYFFVISAQRSASGMLLSRSKFAEEFLLRACMHNCNPCRSSVDSKSKLGHDVTLSRSSAESEYRSVANVVAETA